LYNAKELSRKSEGSLIMSRKCNEIEMHSPQFSTMSTEGEILLGHYKEPMSLAEVLTKSKECSVKKWLFMLPNKYFELCTHPTKDFPQTVHAH
jgi:hypothetical protein